MISRIGHKAAGLNRLSRDVMVPEFVVLETGAFWTFVDAHSIRNLWETYWALVRESGASESLDRARTVLIRAFLTLNVDCIREAVSEALERLRGVPLIARSSATCEDGEESSWAGQFSSTFEVQSYAEWILAVRRCWASLASGAVAAYARANGISEVSPSMAVVLQRAIDAVASGVVFSADSNGATGQAILEATWGLAGPLVSGSVTPERWTWTRASLAERTTYRGLGPVSRLPHGRDSTPGISEFLELWNGDQLELRSIGFAAFGGAWTGTPIDNGRRYPVLDSSIANRIFEIASQRSASNGRPVDLEFAIDRSREIWWVQERPVTARMVITDVPEGGENAAIATGSCGSPGVADGWGWFPEDEPTVPGRPFILFKDRTEPADVPDIVTASGVVTRDGGLLSHAAIICRELKLPSIVGTRPFPPEFNVRRMLRIDATKGAIYDAATPTNLPPASVAGLRNLSVYKFGSGTLSNTVVWNVPQMVDRALPEELRGRIERLSGCPGIVGPIHIMPDVRLTEDVLGFPVGAAFTSLRFHPTAVTDCGDGFRLSEIVGLRAEQIEASAAAISTLIQDRLSGTLTESSLDLASIFSSGLDALSRTRWADTNRDRVECAGKVLDGSAEGLPGKFADLAHKCLFWHGECGHFLEIHFEPEAGRILLLIHSGSIELGLEFLRHAVLTGSREAERQGLDDPDRILQGFWGVDTTTEVGGRLTRNALGLVNYSFVRRAILQHVVQDVLKAQFGPSVRLNLESDVMHTGLRITERGLVHQQGVQRSDALKAPSSVVISGSPHVHSFRLAIDRDSPRVWLPHGKVNFGFDDGVRDNLCAPRTPVFCSGQAYVDPRPERTELETLESVAWCKETGAVGIISPLVPLMSIRGRYNGWPKLL